MKYLREPFNRFFKLETSSSILLFIFTILALIIANTGFYQDYFNFLHKKITIGYDQAILSKSAILWINDGLMAIFFFVIGLEIKREIFAGELSDLRKMVLPISAALGGMIVPIAFFLMFKSATNESQGWAIPIAADIAFTLGILKLLGKKVPYGLIVFVTAFAIVDDLGSILIIAIFYSTSINWSLLIIALCIIVLLCVFSRFRLYSKYIYFIAGIIVWFLILKSGIHATIAGVLMALTIPLTNKINKKAYYKNVNNAMSEFCSKSPEKLKNWDILNKEESGAIDTIEKLTEEVQPPLQYLENKLHHWVAYLIMPVFAFANAGVVISTSNFSNLSIIIALSLVIGNFVGISLFSYISIKLRIAKLPDNVNFSHIIGVSILGGVGFTMALFITNLAYQDQQMIDSAKIGIIIGSLFAGILGYVVLRYALKSKAGKEVNIS